MRLSSTGSPGSPQSPRTDPAQAVSQRDSVANRGHHGFHPPVGKNEPSESSDSTLGLLLDHPARTRLVWLWGSVISWRGGSRMAFDRAERFSGSSGFRAYIGVWSKGDRDEQGRRSGLATLVLEHLASSQAVRIPVYPSNGVEEALPFLEPVCAHYVRQWRKLLPPDPTETDARLVFVEGLDFPGSLANWLHKAELDEIARTHTPEWLVADRASVGISPEGLWRLEPRSPISDPGSVEELEESMLAGSEWEEACPAEELGIALWTPGG